MIYEIEYNPNKNLTIYIEFNSKGITETYTTTKADTIKPLDFNKFPLWMQREINNEIELELKSQKQ